MLKSESVASMIVRVSDMIVLESSTAVHLLEPWEELRFGPRCLDSPKSLGLMLQLSARSCVRNQQEPSVVVKDK